MNILINAASCYHLSKHTLHTSDSILSAAQVSVLSKEFYGLFGLRKCFSFHSLFFTLVLLQ